MAMYFDDIIWFDFATLLSEQYSRMQNAVFYTPSPAAGGLVDDVIYQAT
jgi:hypothetical protein